MFSKSKHVLKKATDSSKHFRNYTKTASLDYLPTIPSGEKSFKLKKVLLVTKLSRFEFERQRHSNLNENQLEHMLRNRGSDYDSFIYFHCLNKEFETKVAKSFQNAGVEVKITNRTSLSKDAMKWADLLVPVGGDGTFLLAAGRASPLFGQTQHKTPIIGFNSSPETSEGRLMLPKYYSEHPDEAVKKILSGNFKWMHRSRIRTTLLGKNGKIPESVDLHGHSISKMEQEDTYPEYLNEEFSTKYKAKMKRVLPYLALNEVFIGETLSARVSHLHLILNHSNVINKTKCSGLCVSTGTGSTSWHTSINRLSPRHVEELQKILPELKMNNMNSNEISEKYNQSLLFSPDDPRLCYSIREQICVGVWPIPKDFEPRNYVKTLFVKSKCLDASLVIDGSISYPFNDGTKALLEINPEDALLAISLN